MRAAAALLRALRSTELRLPFLQAVDAFFRLSLIVQLKTLVLGWSVVPLRLPSDDAWIWYFLHLRGQRLVQGQFSERVLRFEDASLVLDFLGESQQIQLLFFKNSKVPDALDFLFGCGHLILALVQSSVEVAAIP